MEYIIYSASSLVVPRTEEQISAPIAVKKFKRPLISGWEGPSCCPKCSKLCYDQFGVTLEASNHPHLFTGRLPPGYWLVIGIAAPAQLMQQYLSGSPTPIFPNFAKSYFSTLSTYIAQHCILMLNGAISYFLAPVFHTFLSHHCTMWLSFSKSSSRENLFLCSHFIEIWLFQTEYLEIVLRSVSLLVYIWGLVEHGHILKNNLQ